MPTPKICGIETEYGIFVRGGDITPMMASSLIVNAYSDDGLSLRVWDFASEQPDRDDREGWRPEADYPEVEVLMANTVLTNGARYYVDHAHPEMSTPECRSVSDVVRFDRAGEEIVRRSMQRANSRLPNDVEILLHKNNSDGKGNSYGCHENYLLSRAVPFGRLASHITSHFVSRQVYTGAGKVGVECRRDGEIDVAYQVSQRADFFEEEVGLETTIRRPIINTRDEPHCDPEVWRRLHVIAGDANMSEMATFLKVGTTAILLGMIEDNLYPEHLVIHDPVTEIRRVSHDPELQHAITLTNGSTITALELQWELLRAAHKWVHTLTEDPLHGDSEEVLREWEAVLHLLDTNIEAAADTVDWVAKKRLIDGMSQRHNLASHHPKLRAIDLQYHDMNPQRCLALRVGLRTRVNEADVTLAISNPPPDTRAYFRGSCINKWPKSVSSANWDSVVFDIGGPLLQRVPTMDPLKGTQALVGELISRSDTPDQLLGALGDDAVEGVEDDPGW